jgi:hypothetical protein
VLIGGGTNNLLNGSWPLGDLQEIWSIFKEDYKDYNITVVACTVPPFGGYSLADEDKNAQRKALNDEIRRLKGTVGGPDEVIELDLPLSQGGMADENNPDLLHKDFLSTDGLHPAMAGPNKTKGYGLMASLMQKSLGKSFPSETFLTSAQRSSQDAKNPEHQSQNIERTANLDEYKAGNEQYHERNKDRVVSTFDDLGNFEPVRMNINIANFDPNKPTRVVVFATANGRTPEATRGSLAGDASNRYQLTDPQFRKMRERAELQGINLVPVYLTPQSTSWRDWEKGNSNRGAIIKSLMGTVRSEIESLSQLNPPQVTMDLSGCSGGGAFIREFTRHGQEIPQDTENIYIFDANYGYEGSKDVERYAKWLQSNPSHHLTVISGDKGNHEKFELLKNDLQQFFPLEGKTKQGFDEYTGLNGQIRLVKFHGDNHHGETVMAGLEYSVLHSFNIDNRFTPGFRDLKAYTDQTLPPTFKYT